MKKGLLSLLALALTVVGCQNYDDQFAELTSQISSLQSTVDGLTGVSSAITALQSTVEGISTAVEANGTAITADLAQVSQTLADLAGSLSDVATSADLDSISSTLADVQADVRELLEANAVINQNITINNAATLEYVNTLISTGADDPNVIVNGKVDINTTSFTPAITAEELAQVNAIATKLATILGDGAALPGLKVTSATPLTFSNLAFIDDDYEINGSDQDDPNLRTVSGGLKTDYAGPQDYSQLTSVGDVTITNNVSATVINFSNTEVGTLVSGTAAAGVLTFANALSVDLGTAAFTSLTANSAATVNVDATGFAAATTIEATAATSIDLNSAVSAVGLLTITGSNTTIIHADALATADDITVTNSGESHFGALTFADDALNITASDASNFGVLTSTDAASSIGGETVIIPVLAAATGTLTLPNATAVDAPVFVGSTGNGITAPSALTVSVESIAAADLSANSMTTLTTTAQAENLTIADLTYPALTTITVDGKDITGITTLAISITSNATVTSVTVGGEVSALTIAGTGHDTLVTSGNITTLTVSAGGLDTATLGHTYISGDVAVTIDVQGTSLAALDLSEITKVKAITISGNSALKTVVGPSASTLPEAGAAISVTMGTNSITAAYTDGADGVAATETTPEIPAVEPIITSASINSILTWWNAAAANADAGVATSTSIDLSYISYDNAGTAAFGTLTAAYLADTYASGTGSLIYVGAITSNAERAIVTE